ncbi:MAG: hypothetical protein AAF797_10195 [Planctomycetota bacterium]
MAGNKLLLLIGSIAYILFLVLAWLTYTVNVEFSLVISLALFIQALAGVPVLLNALGLFPLPVAAYSKALFALVAVLTIGGMIGVPRGASVNAAADRIDAKIAAITLEQSEEEDAIEEALEAAEKDGDDTEKFNQALADANGKIKAKSKFDKDAIKELNVLEQQKRIVNINRVQNRQDLEDAMPRNILIVLAAFIILLGGHASADVFDALPKPAPKPAAPAAPSLSVDPPTATPPAPDAPEGGEEPTKTPD